jgi:ActR/RegA family two-component response regulator
MAEPAVRVLPVDDDEDEYVIAGDLLRAACTERFELKWAPTYEEGLAAILASDCDVCLVDYRLGERNGLESYQVQKVQRGG